MKFIDSAMAIGELSWPWG